jgi:hypothetical protein
MGELSSYFGEAARGYGGCIEIAVGLAMQGETGVTGH